MDKLIGDSMSSDKSVREKAKAEVKKLSPAQKREFDQKRKHCFDT